MANEGNFDLSGVFHVQQNYLTDLSNSYPDVNNAPLIAKYVLELQDKTKEVDTSYQNANTSADAVLTQQNEMIDIVSKEQKRLSEKKFLIDQAERGEQRKILLTTTNTLRAAEYTKIVLCAVAGLVIHVVLRLIKNKFIEEPSTQNIDVLFIILHIVNILIWTISMGYIYVNIQSRSQINFNQLELPPPSMSGDSATPAVANYNNLFKDLGVCVEEKCCGSNTVWNSTSGECRESFADYSSLDTDPGLIPKPPPVPSEQPPYDNNTATDDERTQHINAKVAAQFAGVNTDIDSAVAQAAASDDLSEYGISDISSLVKAPSVDELAPDILQVKCNFTTMEQDFFATDKSKLKNIGDNRIANKIAPYSDKDQSDLNYSDYP